MFRLRALVQILVMIDITKNNLAGRVLSGYRAGVLKYTEKILSFKLSSHSSTPHVCDLIGSPKNSLR